MRPVEYMDSYGPTLVQTIGLAVFAGFAGDQHTQTATDHHAKSRHLR